MRSPLARLRRTAPAGAAGSTAPSGSDVSGTVRTRKRFARRQWRRRWLAWKYVAVLAALVVLVVVAIYAVGYSSWLSVKGVDAEVEGASGPGSQRLTAAQVESAAAVPTGGPLLRADLGAIAARVRGLLPAVKSVEVSREWPNKVRIDVTQRTPVAVIEIGGTVHALDTDGQIFFTYAKAPAGLPTVRSTSSDRNALAQGAQIAASLPASLAKTVDHVQIASEDDIRLKLRDGANVVWGSAADSGLKADDVVALMKAQPHASTYDVSVPGSPTAG